MNRIAIAFAAAVALGTLGYLLIVFFALTDRIIPAWLGVLFIAIIFIVLVIYDILTEEHPVDEE